jgi:chemotaxis signal transduction protein
MNDHSPVFQRIDLLTEEEFWNYARVLAQQIPAPLSASFQEYLICELSQEAYVFPLSALNEVVPAPHRFARLPSMPSWMPGLVAWRGQTIAVVDLDAYLSGHSIAYPTEGTLLVTNYSDRTLGLLVPTIGQMATTERPQLPRAEASEEAQAPTTASESVLGDTDGERTVFDLAAFFSDVIEKIEVAALHG